MGSLPELIKEFGKDLDEQEVKELKGMVMTYRNDGYSTLEASRLAVKNMIKNIDDELSDIMKQVTEQRS